MTTIATVADLRTWIANCNPGGVLTEPSLVEPLTEALRTAPGRPAWGEDWEEWLAATAAPALVRLLAEADAMPGTRANPMPGATAEEIGAARHAWAAADPLTQEQRNEIARANGWTVKRLPA